MNITSRLRAPGLKSRITGLALLIFLSCIWVLIVGVSSRLERDLTELLSAQQFSVASYIAEDIDNSLRQRVEALSSSAAHVTPEMLSNPEKARSFLRERVALNSLFKAGLVFIRRDGQGFADYPHIAERQGGRYETLEYFQDVLATGKPAIGKARIGRFTKLPGIAVAVPVRNARDEVVAVLAGYATLSDPSLFGRVEGIRIGQSGYIVVDDPRYRLIVTSSDPLRILGPMAAPGVNAMLDRFVAGFEGSGTTVNSKGIEVLTSAKRVPTAGWIVQAILPAAEAFAPIGDMRRAAYRLAMVLSLLVALLTWLVVRRAFRPLDAASAAIRSMVDGEGTLAALPVSGDDEIGDLLTSFNRLVQQRKQVEDALAESENELRTIIDTEPECVKVLAPDGTLLQINRAGLDMIEADSEEQVIGRVVNGVVAPECRDAFAKLNRSVNQGKSGMLEFEIVGLKGTRRWLETHAVPLRDSTGRIKGSLCVTRDITERRKIETALKESEARFRNTLESAPIGMIVAAPDGHVLQSNRALCTMLGYDRNEIGNLTLRDISHPDDLQPSLDNIRRALDGEINTYALERRYLRSDGQPVWVEATATLVRSAEGVPLYFIVQIQDISERKRIHEALKASEERFRTVADYNYDWEYWRGPEKKFIYMSPACERITGYTAAEFMADETLVDRVVYADDRRLMANHLSDYRDDREHSLDFRIVGKNGGIRWIAHGCRPVYGKDGTFMGRRVSNRDITERKQAEAGLVEAKEQLALALEASSLSLWDFDIRTGLVYLDDHWARIVDAVAGATVKPVAELAGNTDARDTERIMKSAVNAFKGTSPLFQEDFRFRTESGKWKWIRCSGKVVERDANGRALRAIGTNLDIHERKEAEERIRQLAYYDTLTDLPNRRLLLDRMNQALSQARRFERSLAVMFLDLDNFKQINDTLGHDVGDELLKEVARRFSGCIRTGDTLSRQGGDEFVIVLAEIAQPADAALVAGKILRVLDEPVRVAERALKITTSIGISVYPVDGSDDAQGLMKKADIAMYAAKKAGRNGYMFFDGLEPPAE